MTDLTDTIDLSLLLVRSAKYAGITKEAAKTFLDALAALPNEAGQRILKERQAELVRRANAAARKGKRA